MIHPSIAYSAHLCLETKVRSYSTLTYPNRKAWGGSHEGHIIGTFIHALFSYLS